MVEVDDITFEFSTADIKGLLTESHYSVSSRFYGKRFYGEDEDDIKDLNPANFQKIDQLLYSRPGHSTCL